MAPLIILLGHRDRLTRDSLHERILNRLTKEGWCNTVRYVPSRIRRRAVHAQVDPTVLLEAEYPVDNARLEVRFWKPASPSYEYYWINWVEPERELMIGWHQDGEHDTLGECHVQLDYGSETVTREAARFIDAHPLAVFEHRLEQLPAALAGIRWEDEKPTFGTWPPPNS